VSYDECFNSPRSLDLLLNPLDSGRMLLVHVPGCELFSGYLLGHGRSQKQSSRSHSPLYILVTMTDKAKEKGGAYHQIILQPAAVIDAILVFV
jgi:hypothetical protein